MMTLAPAQINKFNEHGYIIIDDFLPADTYDWLMTKLTLSESIPITQIRPKHYNHVFSSDNKTLPRVNETYIAKFGIIDDKEMLNPFFHKIVPLMKEVAPIAHALYPGCVRLKSGDGYRAHQDSYAGIVGYSYFANDGWCADYGGLLTYVRSEDEFEVIFPKPNRLLLRNEKFKQFHYLNTIEQYCPREQFIILGWADSKKGETSHVRGEYLDVT